MTFNHFDSQGQAIMVDVSGKQRQVHRDRRDCTALQGGGKERGFPQGGYTVRVN